MKQLTSLLLLVTIIYSCSDRTQDNLLNTLNLQITSPSKILDYSNFLVILTNKETNEKIVSKAPSSGKLSLKLQRGIYSIYADDSADNAITMSGKITEYNFNSQVEDVFLEVSNVIASNQKLFVLDELYFNGAMNNWLQSRYDQYFTIRNISKKALYADGLSFGIMADYNTFSSNEEMSKFLPKYIVLNQLYTIPGKGKEHRVEPNQSLVIAFSAQNHKNNGRQPNSLDLSGANFEIFIEGGPTTDNLDVPNVIINHTNTKAFQWAQSGATPLVLLYINEALANFIDNNKIKLVNIATLTKDTEEFIKIPVEYIIDGVETGLKDGFIRKVLPKNVDQGVILIDDNIFGGFKEQFIQRKPILNEDGDVTVQVTGDSSKDFIVNTSKQKSYPKR